MHSVAILDAPENQIHITKCIDLNENSELKGNSQQNLT